MLMLSCGQERGFRARASRPLGRTSHEVADAWRVNDVLEAVSADLGGVARCARSSMSSRLAERQQEHRHAAVALTPKGISAAPEVSTRQPSLPHSTASEDSFTLAPPAAPAGESEDRPLPVVDHVEDAPVRASLSAERRSCLLSAACERTAREA